MWPRKESGGGCANTLTAIDATALRLCPVFRPIGARKQGLINANRDKKLNGWYAMKRGWLDHRIFRPKKPWSRAEAWIWMVENAAYKPTKIDIDGRPHTVPRGSLCHSLRFMAGKWGWSPKVVSTFIDVLVAHGVVEKSGIKTETASRSRRTQLRLCNYEKYQGKGNNLGGDRETTWKQLGNKEEQGNKETILPSEEADASQPVQVSVLTTACWNAGKQYLTSQGVRNPGGLIGKWLKDHQAVDVLLAVEQAQKCGTQDAVPYITAALKQKGGPDLDALFASIKKDKA